jgi:hypothetical protein
VLAAIPMIAPGTVSQFGMRRLRKSVHAAIVARITAPASKTGFKLASRVAIPHPDTVHQFESRELEIEKYTFLDNIGTVALNQPYRTQSLESGENRPSRADFHIAGTRSQ